ncbi:hypothetical protein [Silvimonas iriomotensis]|uniref:Uncharacterized protein n=1 Tax=Silvimonas iriomotensis TaxID=449662 RepID=A0ABQ2PCU7_9NEIS|nr:hypothetical protein [Silvimonas iriomotensis]GGP23047.1 hypothetical protein GCM10010970_30470 [Silvimonas iriomotensis]
MLDVIYRKTQAGLTEIQTRASGLSLKQRQLLIMIDGKTPAHALPMAMPEKDLVHKLLELEWDGLIERAGSLPPKTVAAAPAAAPAPAAVAATSAVAGGFSLGLNVVRISAGQVARIRSILHMTNQNHLSGELDEMIGEMEHLISVADIERCIARYLQVMKARGLESAAQTYLAQIRTVVR